MRHELIEQLLAGYAADAVPGPSALDLEQTSYPEAAEDAQHAERAKRAEERTPAVPVRLLTAFDVADEDAEARSFARRRLLGVAVAGTGSTVALAAALALGL